MKKGDPLIFHDHANKSEKINLGVKSISGHVFIPSIASAPFLFKGHGQTFLIGLKDKFGKKTITYDSRELFKYKDGGQAFLDLKGSFNSDRPILFVIPGLTSTSYCSYVMDIAK